MTKLFSEELQRTVIAYPQAMLGAIEWARDAVGRDSVEAYSAQGEHSHIRRLGVTAVGRVAEKAPWLSVQSVLGRLVLDELDVLSIGAEAVVLDEGETVTKILTGKTQNPAELAERVDSRRESFADFMGDYYVSTTISVEKRRVFKWLPELDYVCAVQPKLDILKQDALEDDEYLQRNPQLRAPLQDVIKRLQQYTDITDNAYDVAKRGNVVLLGRDSKPTDADKWWCPAEPQVVLPDVMIANLEDKDFIGLPLPFSSIWTPQIYRDEADGHALRLAA